MSDPLILLVLGLLLVAAAAVVFWPRDGLMSRLGRLRRRSEHVLLEDALKHLYKLELEGRMFSLAALAGGLEVRMDRAGRLLEVMEGQGLVEWGEGQPRLTDVGRASAVHVVRAHRLWERHLADRTGYAETDWHGLAERREHDLSSEEVQALAAELGHPTHDPHGDPIPAADGTLQRHGGQPLTTAAVGSALRIVHLEDEPEAVYAQLVAEGLRPGMRLRVARRQSDRVTFHTEAGEHVLAPLLAANVSVAAAPEADELNEEPAQRLSDLAVGEQGRVVRLSRSCRGAERRRLLDLGLTAGTVVEAELQRSGGVTTAYRIRDALIALRREQAARIYVERIDSSESHEPTRTDLLV